MEEEEEEGDDDDDGDDCDDDDDDDDDEEEEEEEEPEEETKGSANQLKNLEVVKHKKLLFLYFAENSNNSPTGLKSSEG